MSNWAVYRRSSIHARRKISVCRQLPRPGYLHPKGQRHRDHRHRIVRSTERAAFMPDGKYLLVGNYLDQDISILKVNGTEITDTGKRFKLPGHPASVPMSTH